MNSSHAASLGHSNSTVMRNREEKWVGVLQAVLLGFILFAAVVGNALVCAVVHRRGEIRRTVTHIFIVSLAVTDISVALLCMPFSLITAVAQTWIFSRALCLLNGFLNVFFLLASILTLTAISVYKYIRIVKPVSWLITRKRALFGLAFIWFLALFTALTPLMGWSNYEYIEGRTQCSVKVPQNAAELTNCLFVIICGFVLPLGVMSFSYHKIFHTVRRHTKRVRLSQVFDNRENSSFLSERRITITLFIILAVFLGCWCPFSILTAYATVTGKELSKHFSVAAYWLGFLNSALNPVIYALRTREFRDGYREILGFAFPCCFNQSVRRTINTTFRWSQADQRSRLSSGNCQAIKKVNSVSAKETSQERRSEKRAAANICKEEDIALEESVHEQEADGQRGTNKREEAPSTFGSEESSFERPGMRLSKDEALTTSTNEVRNLPRLAETGIPNRCFVLDRDDGGGAEEELGCSRQRGNFSKNETEATDKLTTQPRTQSRKRSHSDSAIKYRKQRENSASFRRAGGVSVYSTRTPRSNNEGGAAEDGTRSLSCVSGPGLSHTERSERA